MNEAIAHLARGRWQCQAMPPPPAALRPVDEAQAYALQSQLHAHYLEQGLGAVVGCKIGCTTQVMQRYLGIGNPCAGGILAPGVRMAHGEYVHDEFVRVGVECELAVRLGHDLPEPGAAIGISELTRCIDSLMCAIEVVDDRWQDYRGMDTPSLIADDFFGAGAVLGEPCASWQELDLGRLRARMWVNDENVGEGQGADILGDPLQALAWLANAAPVRAVAGAGVKAGSVVLLGSMVQTCWLARGDRVRIQVQELGGVSASFA